MSQYDAVADDYHLARARLPIYDVFDHSLLARLGDVSGKSVLDVACGAGWTARLLKRRGAARIVGVDASRDQVRLAEEHELDELVAREIVETARGFELVDDGIGHGWKARRSGRERPAGESNTRKGDSMAKAAAGGGGADSSVADQLRALGVKGVLVQMAERGQLLALKCEMPQCYHHKGRGAFDPVTTPRTKWAPSPDHYPILKSAGGQLVPENVRLSHVWCNNRDYGWRTQIRTLLAKGKSLAEIAEALNSKGVPPAHGTNRWTAAMVRKAYVS